MTATIKKIEVYPIKEKHTSKLGKVLFSNKHIITLDLTKTHESIKNKFHKQVRRNKISKARDLDSITDLGENYNSWIELDYINFKLILFKEHLRDNIFVTVELNGEDQRYNIEELYNTMLLTANKSESIRKDGTAWFDWDNSNFTIFKTYSDRNEEVILLKMDF